MKKKRKKKRELAIPHPEPDGSAFVWNEEKLQFEDATNGVVDEASTYQEREQIIRRMASLLAVHRRPPSAHLPTGWFDGDITSRLPPGRYVCIEWSTKRASVFSVPENCTDLLQGASMGGQSYLRLGPPTEDQPIIREP